MKLSIFTFIHQNRRCFEWFKGEDIATNESYYKGDERHDFEISKDELDTLKNEILNDEYRFDDCMEVLSEFGKRAIIRNLYVGDFNAEHYQNAIDSKAEDLAISDWIDDKLEEVELIYKEEN